MRFKAIMTHNPQDFFNGSEPYELCSVIRIESQNGKREIPVILDLVAAGYKAVIVREEDDDG